METYFHLLSRNTKQVRIQSQNMANREYTGALDCLRKTLKRESAGALYKGVSSPLVGSMFINAVIFGVEENTRRYLSLADAEPPPPSQALHDESIANSSNSSTGGWQHYKLYALSGGITGLVQAFLLSPVELVKIKMQVANTSYSSTWDCAKKLIWSGRSSSGYANTMSHRSIMRGTWLTVMRDVPGTSTYFVAFEYLANSYGPCRDQLSVTNLLMAGGFAGCISWLFTYPIDVIKTRFQADDAYTSMRECVRKTLRSEGYMGLWRGLSPTLLR